MSDNGFLRRIGPEGPSGPTGEQRPGRAARRRARRLPPPLPQRDGLDAVRWRIPQDAPAGHALTRLLERFPALGDPAATPLGDRFAAGEVVDAHGRAWGASDPVGPGDELWFHRELREEEVPGVELPVLLRDEHLLVLDKPHDMATMPRGAHVLSSALVRLRRATGLADLVPLHRLDRRTAGVLAFGIVPAERAAYQQLFATGQVRKEYVARILPGPGSPLPRLVGECAVLEDHLDKPRASLQTLVRPGLAPNAHTDYEVLEAEPDGVVRVRLRPRTGRTHQLRVQLASRGAPILGEDLYPRPVAPDGPLQLLARSLAFDDPLAGAERVLRSRRSLAGPDRILPP